MPYIYSNAARVWTDDYTIMRSLLFDFAEDKRAAALGDEYMFGDSLLVCPVTEPMYYEQGKYNQISLIWKDDERCLTVGAAEHTFAQGLKGRECRVILEGDKVEKRFAYDGKEQSISL